MARSKTRTKRWDAADHFKSDADNAGYLEAALEDGDPALVAAALGDIARAKGMATVARKTGLGRETLYKALSADGNPELATVLRVVHALGLRLQGERLLGAGLNPAWSPDGKKIVFNTGVGTAGGGIFAMGADGSGLTLRADSTGRGTRARTRRAAYPSKPARSCRMNPAWLFTIFSAATSRVNHPARSTSGNSCCVPEPRGHSMTNVLLVIVTGSTSPFIAHA